MYIGGHIGMKGGAGGTGGTGVPGDPIVVTIDPNSFPIIVQVDTSTGPISVNVDNEITINNSIPLNVTIDTSTGPVNVEINNPITIDTSNGPIEVSLDSLPRHIVYYCLDGQYDGQDVIFQLYSDGTMEYILKDGTPGSLPASDPSKIVCSPPVDPKKVYWEIVRLDGNLNQAAVPFRPAVGAASTPALPASQGAPGNTFCITGEYKSWATRWLRETQIDAEFEITGIPGSDGEGYRAGSGCLYVTDLLGFDTDENEMYCQEVCFKAKPGAYVEILITRCL